MLDNTKTIHKTYALLMDILLRAEGDITAPPATPPVYTLSDSVHIPAVFIPLLYTASHAVQIATSFLPFYLQHDALGSKDTITALKTKIINDKQWFTQEIYPNLLKFLLGDSLRTVAVPNFTDFRDTINIYDTSPQTVFIYDAQCTPISPYKGIDIANTKEFANSLSDSQKTIYLVGGICKNGLNILRKHKIQQVIYGINPCHTKKKPLQDCLYARLNFFSKTILAGSLNMQLPFIEHYFQAGITPLSFYHLLYRTKTPNIIIKNALCLLNTKQIIQNISDYINYHRLPSHTDITDTPLNASAQDNKVNYLKLLSCYA